MGFGRTSQASARSVACLTVPSHKEGIRKRHVRLCIRRSWLCPSSFLTIGARVIRQGRQSHLVLYHRLPVAGGCKRSAVNAFQDYLVLYHIPNTPRQNENQLPETICRGYLVLYHSPWTVPSLCPPLLHVFVAAGKVTGVVCYPLLLGSLLAGILAGWKGTCPLSLSDSWIRNKETTAKFATGRQWPPPGKLFQEAIVTNLRKLRRRDDWRKGTTERNRR